MSEYQDINGNPCSLDALCVDEPAWAANRIRALIAEGSLFREQLQNIAQLDYENAATNCAAHSAVVMARTVLGTISTETYMCTKCGKTKNYCSCAKFHSGKSPNVNKSIDAQQQTADSRHEPFEHKPWCKMLQNPGYFGALCDCADSMQSDGERQKK